MTLTSLLRRAVPLMFADIRSPAAMALREASEVIRPYSVNKRVRPYNGPIYVSVFS
jgi:hypothetical protein